MPPERPWRFRLSIWPFAPWGGKPVWSGENGRSPAGLFDGDPTMSLLFWHEGSVWLLRSQLHIPAAGLARLGVESSFVEEALFKIPSRSLTKAMLAREYDELAESGQLSLRRSGLGSDERRFLPADVSIASALGGGVFHLRFDATDRPLSLIEGGGGVGVVLRAFDPAVEYLDVEDNGRAFRLKLATVEEPMTLSREGLEDALSSGTIKGLMVAQRAVLVLREGGYLLLDEIENHLNRQLVNVILELFSSRQTNPAGAVLVFTTHYPEVLDSVHRKDNVYFLARGDHGRSRALKYSDKVKRIENKKSEVFRSNFVGGTAPRYSDVLALKRFASDAVRGARREQ